MIVFKGDSPQYESSSNPKYQLASCESYRQTKLTAYMIALSSDWVTHWLILPFSMVFHDHIWFPSTRIEVSIEKPANFYFFYKMGFDSSKHSNL